MERIVDHIARINQKDTGKPRKRIVVLGAGMAGLSAAYELARLGHAVSVLEATNRAGGRVWTKRFASGEYHELGAMRIPASHDYTRYYVNVVGLNASLRAFITSHENRNCFYHLRGKVCRIKDAALSLLGEYRLSTLERQVATNLVAPAIFGIHLENVLNELNREDRESLFGRRFLTDRVAKLDAESLGEFLERRLYRGDARELIGSVTGLEVWWEMAMSMFLRDEISENGIGLQEIAGGMDLLPTALAATLPSNTIRYNVEVTSIRLVDRGVRIGVRPTQPPRDGSTWDSPPTVQQIQEEHADFVICTIPFGVLRRMELTGLSSQKMCAVRNLNYASSTKVLLHCRERFWEQGGPDERIIGGASFSDSISRATYYPSDHAVTAPTAFAGETNSVGFRGSTTSFSLQEVHVAPAFSIQPGPGVLVGSYNWGRDARRLGTLSVRERADAVIDSVRHFHPTIDSFVDDVASMYWDDFRWSRGAFCFMQPGDLRHYYHPAIQPEGRLHFAGEHCSLDQGWIQGAVISGLRAVEEVVDC